MALRTGLTEAEYLHTSFPDLDKEYRDGELVERSLPTYIHSRTQTRTAFFFERCADKLPVFTCVELRMRIRPGLYLIPDVAVFYPEQPPNIPDNPPLIAIEILSEDDRMPKVEEKLELYRQWGVPHVWLVDPQTRRLYRWAGALEQRDSLAVPELGLELKPADAFEVL